MRSQTIQKYLVMDVAGGLGPSTNPFLDFLNIDLVLNKKFQPQTVAVSKCTADNKGTRISADTRLQSLRVYHEKKATFCNVQNLGTKIIIKIKPTTRKEPNQPAFTHVERFCNAVFSENKYRACLS